MEHVWNRSSLAEQKLIDDSVLGSPPHGEVVWVGDKLLFLQVTESLQLLLQCNPSYPFDQEGNNNNLIGLLEWLCANVGKYHQAYSKNS